MKKKSKKKKIDYKIIKRWTVLFVFLAVLLSIKTFSDDISDFFLKSTEYVSNKSGLIVKNISITGETSKISKNIGISIGENIFKISSLEIKNNIMKNNWVKSITVHKKLPNTINIHITQKSPIAIFQSNEKFYFISESGEIIEKTTLSSNYCLPIITGENSAQNVKFILETINKFDRIAKKLNSLSFIRQRRWDIIICRGITVKLPEENINHALEILSELLKNPAINKNRVSCIDLRVPENIILSDVKQKSEKDLIV